MSKPQTTPEQSAATTQAAPTNGSSKRLVILLCILALGLVGMGYDQYVARPAVEAAYQSIIEKHGEINATPGKTFTNKDVQELIGKTPARTLTNPDGNTVEIYQWRAGLPIRTHDLFAIYKTQDDALMFQEGGMGDYEKIAEEMSSLSGEPTVIQLSEEDISAMSRDDKAANTPTGNAGTNSDAAQEDLKQEQEDQANSEENNPPTETNDPETSDTQVDPTPPAETTEQ